MRGKSNGQKFNRSEEYILRRVKLIYSYGLFKQFNFYQKYLEEFLQQDIQIIDIKQLGDRPGYTTIIYECDESFVDQTGGSTVEITVKKGKLNVIDVG